MVSILIFQLPVVYYLYYCKFKFFLQASGNNYVCVKLLAKQVIYVCMKFR